MFVTALCSYHILKYIWHVFIKCSNHKDMVYQSQFMLSLCINHKYTSEHNINIDLGGKKRMEITEQYTLIVNESSNRASDISYMIFEFILFTNHGYTFTCRYTYSQSSYKLSHTQYNCMYSLARQHEKVLGLIPSRT